MTERSQSISLLSVAKFNPFVQVGSQRKDGYHQLLLGFQFLDLADLIDFELTENKISFDYQLPFERQKDMCYRAIILLQATHSYQMRKKQGSAHLGVKIALNKQIPFGSGLGGGSSNAATTLIALNYLWQLNFNKNQLCQLGASIGADVPIFIHAKAAKAEGIGDQFSDFDFKEKKYLLLYPAVEVATKMIFNYSGLTKRTQFTDWQDEALYKNDFQPATFALYPEVANAHHFLSNFGKVSMSGTGSSLLLDVDHLNKDQIDQLMQKIKKAANYRENWSLYLVKSLNISPLDIKLPIFN